MSGRGWIVVVLACLLAVIPSAPPLAQTEEGQAGQARVLIWPRDPQAVGSAAAAEAALRAGGRAVVPFAPIGTRLQVLDQAAQAHEAAVLTAVERAFDQARQAYLDQRFDDMVAVLGEAEQRSLHVLARPEHASVLWELAFQLGLAVRARGRVDDDAVAAGWFRLALAVDAERRPLRELYGPQVSAAFADALSAHVAAVPRPVRIIVHPEDAQVVIDGVVALGRTRAGTRVHRMRSGLHVVHARAPGYHERAFLAQVDGSAGLEVTLQERVQADPVARMGTSWSAGMLAPGSASSQAAIHAVAAAQGATLVVMISATSDGRIMAQVTAAAGTGEPVTRNTAEEALQAALAAYEHAGAALRGDAGADHAPRAQPWWQRWWVWAGVAAVVATAAVAAGAASRSHGERWQIYVLPPDAAPRPATTAQ